jgi:SAM-dependent methyltransferase
MREATFPPDFFDRLDPAPDTAFYGPERLVTHIDERAIAAVGALYEELGIEGSVLDVMSSWISHFRAPPAALVGLGMNEAELRANRALAEHVVHDLNADPVLPFADESFDHAVCCVSVDYLTRPVEVFAQVARVLRPGGLFVCTFSNRCFPTKAVRGWLATDDAGHVAIVRRYFELTERFEPVVDGLRTDPSSSGDPLYAVSGALRVRSGTPATPTRGPAADPADRSPARDGQRR